tara:strand:+ start:17831 stop:18085 length:255 start_codon:yes stop_codon:yes gene_type:complete
MDRHPQQIKRQRQDKKRRARNITNMSSLRTHIKKILQTTSKKEAKELYPLAVSIIDKSVKCKLIHLNTGARRKSQITRHVNSLN